MGASSSSPSEFAGVVPNVRDKVVKVKDELERLAIIKDQTLTDHVEQFIYRVIMTGSIRHERCNFGNQPHLQMKAINWTLKQCTNVPMFRFDLSVHCLRDWAKLMGPVIHASIEGCEHQRGFIGLEWIKPDSGHETLLFFEGKRQVFFDPSWAADRYETDVVDFFSNNHMWIHADDNPVLEVVDGDRSDDKIDLQTYFEPTTGSGIEGGSCVTVCMVMILCCIRFGCWDLQRMCDALRNALQQSETFWKSRDRFVCRAYNWHKSLDPPDGALERRATGWQQRLYVLQRCGLKVLEGTEPPSCAVVGSSYHNRGCLSRPCTGWVLCKSHLRELLGIEECASNHPVGQGCACGRPMSVCMSEPLHEVPLYPGYNLPFFLRSTPVGTTKKADPDPRVGTVYYFNARYKSENTHLQNTRKFDAYQADGSFAIVRLEGFENDLVGLEQKLALTAWHEMRERNTCLLLQIYMPPSFTNIEELTKIVLRRVPLCGWAHLVATVTFTQDFFARDTWNTANPSTTLAVVIDFMQMETDEALQELRKAAINDDYYPRSLRVAIPYATPSLVELFEKFQGGIQIIVFDGGPTNELIFFLQNRPQDGWLQSLEEMDVVRKRRIVTRQAVQLYRLQVPLAATLIRGVHMVFPDADMHYSCDETRHVTCTNDEWTPNFAHIKGNWVHHGVSHATHWCRKSDRRHPGKKARRLQTEDPDKGRLF